MTTEKIIERVRGVINRPVFLTTAVDENPLLDSNVVDTGSRTVSDETLLRFINQVQRLIVHGCKSFHLQSSTDISTIAGPSLTMDENTGRVIHGRIQRIKDDDTKVRVRYRELAEHQTLETSGRSATEDYPAYLYNDYELDIYPTPTNGTVVEYVVTPPTITIEQHVLGATLTIDDRFEPSVVAYVSSKAFRSLGEDEMSEVWFDLYKRKIQPFLTGVRIGDPSTHIISHDVYERDNEVE